VSSAEGITGEDQGGFWRGRPIVEQIFTLRQILEKIWEQCIDVHRLFIDFQTTWHYGERKYGVKCIK
jgi:hypothetical protein